MPPLTDSAFVAGCIVCGSTRLRTLGRIYHPYPARIAGVCIDISAYDFALIQCLDCRFQYKHPSLPAEMLLACYGEATEDHWGREVDPKERNFDRFANVVTRYSSGRRILDVGCFNGAFLDYLGPDWDRHGVEPSRLAAGLARTRGVQVHARLLDDLPATETFDVITAFDVIEHVVDPALFFGMIRRHLRPNGIAVFSSGDTDSLSWRLQLARYWYCSYLPEHVSFYCRHALNYLASANQMVSVHHSHMSHKRTALSVQAKQAAKGVAYAMLLRLNWLGLPSVRAKYATRGGTDWVAAPDHFIHVMKAL